MKKFLLLASVCLAGILMASCTKDVPDANTFKFDGKSIEVRAAISFVMEGEVSIDFDLANGTHGWLHNLHGCVGKTVELGKAVSGVEYVIGCNGGEPQLGTILANGEFVNNDFKSGKMTIKAVKDGYRLTIDAVLLDGKKLFVDMYAIDERLFNEREK